jgi:hypothetical protein
MSKRTPATFAKRQREMEQKRRADEKRKRRIERKEAGPQEIPVEVCKPFVDEV